MNNYEFSAKEAFGERQKDTYFKKIVNHPLTLYYGFNANGQKTLRYLGEHGKHRPVGTRGIAVSLRPLNDGSPAISFSLAEPASEELFYSFCDDIVQHTFKFAGKGKGYDLIVNRFEQWKRIFGRTKLVLSEQEIMGMVGEAVVLLDKLVPLYGAKEAIESWGANEHNVKDFSIKDTWYEVKTTGVRSKSVTIDSAAQLDSPMDGHLVIVRLERMSESFDGLSLNSLIEKIYSLLESDQEKIIFSNRLLERGYSNNPVYDQYKFSLNSMKSYSVTKEFPAIRPSMLKEEIDDVQYHLNISKLDGYLEDK